MTLFEVRYYFEHKLLPKYYFEDTEPFLTEMLDAYGSDGNNLLYDMISDMAKKREIDLLFDEEQYKVKIYQLEEDEFMIKISLPEPQESTLCSHIYLLFSVDDLSNKRYFTIELLEIKRKRKYYCLCEWEPSGFHVNHGYLPKSGAQIEDKIIELFKNSK